METLLRGSKERADIKIKDELSDVILDWACPDRKDPWDHKSWYHWDRSPKLGQNFSSDSTSFGVIRLLNWYIRPIPFTRVAAWVQHTDAEYLSLTNRQEHAMAQFHRTPRHQASIMDTVLDNVPLPDAHWNRRHENKTPSSNFASVSWRYIHKAPGPIPLIHRVIQYLCYPIISVGSGSRDICALPLASIKSTCVNHSRGHNDYCKVLGFISALLM